MPATAAWAKPTQFSIRAEGVDIKFQFMPRNLKDFKRAVYNDIQIMGRSAPYKSYFGSNARTVSFTLDFFAEKPGDPDKIASTIKTLQTLTYPEYAGVIKPPKKCNVYIGNMFHFVGVCISVDVAYNDTAPWDVSSQKVMYASIGLMFEEAYQIPNDINSTDIKPDGPTM